MWHFPVVITREYRARLPRERAKPVQLDYQKFLAVLPME
jgi:hypothetical protein